MGGKAGGHTHAEASAQPWDTHLQAWTAEESHFGVLRPLSGCCVSLFPGRGEQADIHLMGNWRQTKVPSAVLT